MSVVAFLEPVSAAPGRALTIRDGLGAGISVEGAVLEGRLSVHDALVLTGGWAGLAGSAARWNQAEVDAIWAERESVFGVRRAHMIFDEVELNEEAGIMDSATFDEVGEAVEGEVCPIAFEDILTFARERLGFAVEEPQVPFLTSEAKRGLVNCSRQFGKSTVAAIKVIYRAWTRPGSLILVAGPTKRQSGEMLAKTAALVRAGFPEWTVRGDGFNELSLAFPNGSRIVALPGKEANIRAFSGVSMLVIDEAARVPDELYKALRPMLAVGNGDLWVLSTPKGRRGFFYEEWEFGGSERWVRFEVAATACAPRISAEFLEDEVAAMGAAAVQQEYFCKFIDDGGVWFGRSLVEGALSKDWEAFSFTAEARRRGEYYLGLDLGKLRDYTALALVERVGSEMVVRYVERAALGTPYTRVVSRMEELTRHQALAGMCHLTVDATGVGQPVVESLRGAKLGAKGMTAVTITAGERAREVMRDCWNVPRQDLLGGLQVLLEKGELKIAKEMRDAGTLVRELVGMRSVGAGGSAGEHDDLVLAVALACWQAGRRVGPVGMVGGGRLF